MFRKTLPYARTLVRKMVSVSVLCGNIRRAHALLRESDYNQEALAVLEPVFTPISHADITLRGSFVFEYVCAKRLLEELDLYTLCKLGDFDWDWRAKPGRFRRATSAMLLPVIINRNHTIRELSEIYGKMAEVADRKRDAHVNDEEMAARFGKRLRLKNIGGQLFLLRVVPSVFKACETAQRAQAMSDMLAIEIARQRGQTLDLHDCYTGREYIQDPETAAISCAGPDGEAGTTDDVALDQG